MTATFRNILVFTLALTVLLSTSRAYADPKPWIFSWWESHWENLDFIPYLENGKHPHNSQWNESEWQPAHWAAQRKNAKDVIRGFYFADIIRDQYMDDVPILVVGPAFYQLGGHDKRRVTKMVDSVYGVTTNRKYGMFMLHDWRTKKAIGSYTQYGLQIQ